MNRMDVEREQQGAYFLARLERLCHLEERLVSPPDAVLEPARFVCKAIFATYCDCVMVGRKAEAERLLGERRPAQPSLDTPTSEASSAR